MTSFLWRAHPSALVSGIDGVLLGLCNCGLHAAADSGRKISFGFIRLSPQTARPLQPSLCNARGHAVNEEAYRN